MEKVADGIRAIKSFLTVEKCNSIINRACLYNFQKARMQNKGRYNQETFIYDPEESSRFLFQLQSCITQYSVITTVTSIGKVLECYRYTEGDYITAHCDKSTKTDRSCWSTHTIIIYLNDNFTGGETDFPKNNIKVIPKVGKALLFEHGILHQANQVLEGVKYLLRLNVALNNYESL
jgi:hypothetical protein